MTVASLFDYNHVLVEWVSSKGVFLEWPECHEVFLEKLSADSPSVVALPILSCQAVGGSYADAAPVATAWSMLRYAAELFDAVQDGDSLSKSVNDLPSAIEYANGLIFSAFNAITTINEENTVYRLMGSFSDLAFQATQGQRLSQQYRRKDNATLEMYWQATILKSGSIFRAGLGGGAIIGQAKPDYYTALNKFGNALGVIRQVIDDCRDVFDNSDTNPYEVTLPLLFLSEKLGDPISLLVRRYKSKEALLKALNINGVPEMITSVVLEWRRRALASLMIFERTSVVENLETILQDFITKPRLNFSNE
jgi:geranylgeranyl pyrophosphate synthase